MSILNKTEKFTRGGIIYIKEFYDSGAVVEKPDPEHQKPVSEPKPAPPLLGKNSIGLISRMLRKLGLKKKSKS